MTPGVLATVTGFGLVAVCYGFARFAFGLFLPAMEGDLSIPPTLAGTITGGAFLSYCLTILLSARLTERTGPRPAAVGAALVAAAGLAGIALAPSALWLAGAAILAGSSAGLASPPLAAAVARAVEPARQGAANTVINAGTGAGVVLSGPVALLIGAEWRLAFAVFALCMALAAASLPGGRGGSATKVSAERPAAIPLTVPLAHLIGAALLTGASSTALWSFGGRLAASRLGWDSAGIGLLWIVIGAAGIAGAAAGALVARQGIDRVHRLFLVLMAVAILSVGSSVATPASTIAGGALFGAAYIMLTGVYLVWGVRILPDRPATGLTIGFLTLAVGQALGAPLFGLLMDGRDADDAVLVFAGIALAAGLARERQACPERSAATT